MAQKFNRAQLVDALTKSRELIKLGWMRGSWAKDANGKVVEPWSESACKFCIEGAVLGGTHYQDETHELAGAAIRILQVANKEFTGNPYLLDRMTKGNNGGSKIDSYSVVPSVNDGTIQTQEQAVHLFDNAIRLAKHLKVTK